MSAFDLKSGYHHIDIVDTQHTLLGFAYTDWQGNRRFFQYQVLPFGLSTAEQIFTKLISGIHPQPRKVDMGPKTNLTWLGFIVDLVQGRIFLTKDRVRKTETLIDYILGLTSVPIKLLSKVNGLIISMEKSHGELVYLKTRFLCLCIDKAETWVATEILCPPVREELIFCRVTSFTMPVIPPVW